MLSRRALLGGLALVGTAAPSLVLAEGEELVPVRKPVVRRRPVARRVVAKPVPAASPAPAPAPVAAAPPAPAPPPPALAEDADIWGNPDDALARLKQGAAVFARGGASLALPGWTRIAAVAKAQRPFAIIVGCSDSQVPPEMIFDCSLGDLYVIRVAGATVDDIGLGSILYAVKTLAAPLIVVLGHTQCGAVAAAVDAATRQTDLPGALQALVTPILPAVLKAQTQTRAPADLVDAAMREHVRRTAERLKYADALLASRLAQGKLKIVSACYNLATAEVEFAA
ncbi:MAG: carbonic anhydrase [Caulobacter sp.]|nr:carbonic anhydrase [Caulobacter sp.]